MMSARQGSDPTARRENMVNWEKERHSSLMPFSKEDTDRIRAALRAALESPSLTDWQRNFLGSMQTRFDTYGTRTKLTDKQYAKLKQILAPFQGSTPPASHQASTRRPRPTPAKQRPTSHPQSRSRPPKQIRAFRKARRTVRDSVLMESTVKCGAIMQPFWFLTKVSTPDAIARTWRAGCHRGLWFGFAA